MHTKNPVPSAEAPVASYTLRATSEAFESAQARCNSWVIMAQIAENRASKAHEPLLFEVEAGKVLHVYAFRGVWGLRGDRVCGEGGGALEDITLGFWAEPEIRNEHAQARQSFTWGVSENRGPKFITLNSRILIIRTPK